MRCFGEVPLTSAFQRAVARARPLKVSSSPYCRAFKSGLHSIRPIPQIWGVRVSRRPKSLAYGISVRVSKTSPRRTRCIYTQCVYSVVSGARLWKNGNFAEVIRRQMGIFGWKTDCLSLADLRAKKTPQLAGIQAAQPLEAGHIVQIQLDLRRKSSENGNIRGVGQRLSWKLTLVP